MKETRQKQRYLNIFLTIFLASFLPACTLTMINTSTHGEATDVVDDTSSANADVKPNIQIPLKAM